MFLYYQAKNQKAMPFEARRPPPLSAWGWLAFSLGTRALKRARVASLRACRIRRRSSEAASLNLKRSITKKQTRSAKHLLTRYLTKRAIATLFLAYGLALFASVNCGVLGSLPLPNASLGRLRSPARTQPPPQKTESREAQPSPKVKQGLRKQALRACP